MPRKKIYTDEEARRRKNARQREYARRTGNIVTQRSTRKNSKRYVLQVFYAVDPDIIEKLDSVENKSKYIKDLIRKDING